MAEFLIPGLDEALLKRLESQARAHGNTAAEEALEILGQALPSGHSGNPKRISLADVIRELPDIFHLPDDIFEFDRSGDPYRDEARMQELLASLKEE